MTKLPETTLSKLFLLMTELSDRQHDAFDNPAKAACRQGNVSVLREAAYLLWGLEASSRAFLLREVCMVLALWQIFEGRAAVCEHRWPGDIEIFAC